MILRAQAADAPLMAAICLQSGFAAKWGAGDFISSINNPAARVFKLEECGVLAGFICYSGGGGFYELVNFAVGKNFLRRGFGRQILFESLKQLAQQGVKEVTLEVNIKNSIAVSLYKEAGFKEVGLRKKFYNNTDDALIMTVNL